MNSLRHNPYVGSFHNKNLFLEDTTSSSKNVMMESKSNPLVGVFRHSPANNPHTFGLKGILYQNEENKPVVLSQLQVPRERKNLPIKRSFLQSLKTIPLKKFSTSSLATGSSASVSVNGKDDPGPVCSICIEPYLDGDELLTLACSHCFHRECARKWFFQGCLNNGEDSSFNCPECRQDHVQLSLDCPQNILVGDSVSSRCGEEISSTSFFHVGQSLITEGGYDFMSDVGSESTRYTASSVGLPTGNNTPATTLTRQKTYPDAVVGVSQGLSVDDKTSNGDHDVALQFNSMSIGISVKDVTVVRPNPMAESTYSDCGVPFM
jgi:hypothetical protein